MSSHSDRINAFKKAQCARLKREEDEEQWISGEELCTEGSSDEETFPQHIKTSHKKHHRRFKMRPNIKKNMLPSPLACCGIKQEKALDRQLNKPNETEILKTEHLDNQRQQSAAESLKCQEIAHITDESSFLGKDLPEQEVPIQWRPKKGSFQLASFSEDVTIEHLIHENEAFFQEMTDKIRQMKSKRSVVKGHNCDRINEFNTLPSIKNDTKNLTLFHQQLEEPKIKEMYENIVRNDKKIEKFATDWIMATKQREEVQSDTNSFYNDNIHYESIKISNQEMKMLESSFTNIEFTDFKASTETDLKEENKNLKSVEKATKKKKKRINDNSMNFIHRNKELAKYGNMAICALTDDEKEKLSTLLKEFADDEKQEMQNQEPCMEMATLTEITTDREEVSDDDCNGCDNDDEKVWEVEKADNAFKLFSEEALNMESINARLELLKHSRCSNDGKEQSIDDVERAAEITDHRERKWKEQILMSRLKSINKELGRIAREKVEEEEAKVEERKTKTETENYTELTDNVNTLTEISKGENCLLLLEDVESEIRNP